MSLGNSLTEILNALEGWIEKAPWYFLPLKILGWMVLLGALMVTNLLAIAKWPFSALASRGKKTEQITGEPFDVGSEQELRQLIQGHELVLVDFWAQWCGPCLLMNGAIKNIAKKYEKDLLVVKVDVSTNSELSGSFEVQGLPTVLLFKKNQEFTRKSGALTEQQLCILIDEALAD